MLEISFLCSLKRDDFPHLRKEFKTGLEGAGFGYKLVGWESDGPPASTGPNDVFVHDRWVDGKYDQLDSNADYVVGKADIIVAAGGLITSLAAEKAAAKIGSNKRVLYTSGRFQSEEPASEHNANAKKGEYLDNTPKDVTKHHGHEHLKKVLGQNKKIYHMTNDKSAVRDTEGGWGMYVNVVHANQDTGFSQAFADFKANGDALIVSPDSYFSVAKKDIVAMALTTNKPVCYPFREYVVEAKGLLSVGPRLENVYRDLGKWAAILLHDPNAVLPAPTIGPA